MRDATAAPDLLAILTPLFDQCDKEEQRILLAVLERLAAEHYRAWAAQVSDPVQKQEFLDAAGREEQIAEVVESLDSQAEQKAQALWARFPDMRDIYANTMRPLTLEVQWRVQAKGELGGAQLLRDFAQAETNPEAQEKLLACASKDETNSQFLTDFLKEQSARSD